MCRKNIVLKTSKMETSDSPQNEQDTRFTPVLWPGTRLDVSSPQIEPKKQHSVFILKGVAFSLQVEALCRALGHSSL